MQNLEVDSKFEKIYENLKTEIGNLDELKRQVDLDREKLKSEIDDLADGFIQQLQSYEKKFEAEYKTEMIWSKHRNSN